MTIARLKKLDESGIPVLIARLALGITFVVMGWNKGWDPVGFLKLLREYQMVPDALYLVQNLISVSLPWIEVVCGLALVFGIFTRGSSLTLLLLLTGFTVMIAIRATLIHINTGAPFWQIHFDCGCGGGDVHMYRKIPENTALWVLAWIGFLSQSHRFSLKSLLARQKVKTNLD